MKAAVLVEAHSGNSNLCPPANAALPNRPLLFFCNSFQRRRQVGGSAVRFRLLRLEDKRRLLFGWERRNYGRVANRSC